VGEGMFKYPSLMGIFPLPPPPPIVNIAHINMILLFDSGSIGFVNPWVVPCPKDVESYGSSMPLTTVEIIDLTIPSTFFDIGKQLHPHMECDLPTPPI
jgi:hypothetical protein